MNQPTAQLRFDSERNWVWRGIPGAHLAIPIDEEQWYALTEELFERIRGEGYDDSNTNHSHIMRSVIEPLVLQGIYDVLNASFVAMCENSGDEDSPELEMRRNIRAKLEQEIGRREAVS